MTEKPVKSKSLENEIKEVKRTNEPVEIKYKVDELEKAAKALFGVNPECARAAFLIAKVKEATKTQAQRIINDFMKKEVK